MALQAQAIQLSMAHDDGRFDLRSPFPSSNDLNVPMHSMKSVRINALLARVQDSIEFYLVRESAYHLIHSAQSNGSFAGVGGGVGGALGDPAALSAATSIVNLIQSDPYLQRIDQDAARAVHFNQPFRHDDSVHQFDQQSRIESVNYDPDIDVMAWTLLGCTKLESSPFLHPYSSITMSLVSYFSPSIHSFSPSEADIRRNYVELTRLIDANQGKTWPSLPRLANASTFHSTSFPSTSSFASSSAHLSPDCLHRSNQPLRYMMDALHLAHEVDDLASIAFCASGLASLLLYWRGDSSRAWHLFARLKAESEELLQHLSTDVTSPLDRTFLSTCREYALLSIQYRELTMKPSCFHVNLL
jgi:hypothetical protein